MRQCRNAAEALSPRSFVCSSPESIECTVWPPVAISIAALADEAQVLPPELPVVGGKAPIAEALALVGPQDDVHLLGIGALEAGELLGVKRKLEKKVWFCPAGEFGVGDLVAPGARGGGVSTRSRKSA